MFIYSKQKGGIDKMAMQNNIAKYRKVLNMTQQELADKIGIKRTSLSQIENGVYNPRATTMIKLAESLNVPIGDLFYTSDVYNSETKDGD
jgi:DNA-binding XRE family transcriptional regulator